jgi:hypothetical protein
MFDSVGSTDRVGGGGATFHPVPPTGALLPSQFAIASAKEILPNSLKYLFESNCDAAYVDRCSSAWRRIRFSPMSATTLLCDGCGQAGSPEHVTRRLQRLEWMTRYRPVHVGTVLLGAYSPDADSDFLYAETAEITGEAKRALAACGIDGVGKTKGAILSEFQRGGFLLGYVLECPLEPESRNDAALTVLLQSRMPAFLARLRRSFQPKRVASISSKLDPLFVGLTEKDLGCTLVSNGGKSFAFDGADPEQEMERLRHAHAAARAVSR